MTINFMKMQALGNDFMIINGIDQKINLKKEQIIAWGKRNTGVGFDQLLLVEPSQKSTFDFCYRIFNSNGSEVGQCGNGARCLALFLKQSALTDKNEIKVYTTTTEMLLIINPDKSVSVSLACPKLAPTAIPLLSKKQSESYIFPLANGQQCALHAIQVGNPHAVIIVDEIAKAPVSTLGEEISKHALFPEQANVSFVEISSQDHIKLRVYERGCGETAACGSAAAAAAAVCRLFYNMMEKIRVTLPGGDLVIQWPTINDSLMLTGPAQFVYEGRLKF